MKKPNKKVTIVSLIIIVIITAIAAIFLLFKSDHIPDGYIAVFHGVQETEITYETYIYKDNNGHANYGFTYISTETIWDINPKNATKKIIKRGSFDWTDGAFTAAKENNAYDYVTVPNSDRTYTIEEFMSRFLMN